MDPRLSYGGSVLWTVSSSVVHDLTNLSALKFLGVSDPIYGCAGRVVVCPTDGKSIRHSRLNKFFWAELFGSL